MLLTDSILVKFLKEGNEEVFKSIYERFFGPLYVYAVEYVVDKEVAYEMVQDTFLKLWEKKSTLADDTYLQSYLYRVTRNNCLNYLKHLKVKEKYKQFSKSKQLEINLNFTALNDSSAEKIISDELEEKINKAIDQLPPKCKNIFLLSRYENKKYREIADELGLSVKTVENQIQKALKVLRKHLAEYLPTYLLFILACFQ